MFFDREARKKLREKKYKIQISLCRKEPSLITTVEGMSSDDDEEKNDLHLFDEERSKTNFVCTIIKLSFNILVKYNLLPHV